jgi:2-amino-4-hydroxy-6-hydroxymethyldihydropteridine diphosphokinase
MPRAFLGLGANLGDRAGNMRRALRALEPACRVLAVSSLYRSEAVVPEGAPPGPDYFNAACEVETDLAPHELLAHVKEIERALGREAGERWAARPIDIDILLYGEETVESADLVVPHPRIGERNFVVAPLAELAADVLHPPSGRTVGELALEVDFHGLEHMAGPEWAAEPAPVAEDGAR